MSHGKVITKDKVNIPDWIISNLHKKDDWVVLSNKIYRANNAIPINTPFATGTVGATWTEMAASTGGQFTLTDSVLSTTNGIEADGLIQSNERIFGCFGVNKYSYLYVSYEAVVVPLNITVESEGVELDPAKYIISLTGLADNVKRLNFEITTGLKTGTDERALVDSVTFAVGTSDDGGTTFNVEDASVRVTRIVRTEAFYHFTFAWPSVEHVPGRRYKLYWASSNIENSLSYGGKTYTFPDNTATNYMTSVTVSAS